MLEKPETEYSDPNDFYTKEEVKRYDTNKGMKRSQFFLTKIALDIANIKINKNLKILDVGCGTGFSLEYFLEEGVNKKNLYGIDVSKEMVLVSKKKGFNVKNIGFLELDSLKENNFDVIISISALQWILTNKPEMQIKNELKKIARNIYFLLNNKGVFILQYYPPSKEIIDVVISCIEKQKFVVEEYIYNKDSLKKKKYFYVFYKK
jgi:18S rRNA (guanine1575-N7)-methyltransferase